MAETLTLSFKSEEDALAAMERLVGEGVCDLALHPPCDSVWALSVRMTGDREDPASLAQLAQQSARLTATWRSMMAQHVPMSVAAATVFRRVHRRTGAVLDRRDRDDALNIAAGTLATLVPVYAMNPLTQQRIEVRVRPAVHRFTLGATQLRSIEGQVFGPLSVRRADMLRALSLIECAGLPFSFAMVPVEDEPAAAGHYARQEDVE